MSKRTEPPFRADHVGSLLRPAALKQAREQRAKGEITPVQLKEIENREIERVIKKQEDVGLQSITDGEFRRSWWHLDFLWGLNGIEKHIMDTGVAFAAVTTRNEGLKVTGKVGFSGAVRRLWPTDADPDRPDRLSKARCVLRGHWPSL